MSRHWDSDEPGWDPGPCGRDDCGTCGGEGCEDCDPIDGVGFADPGGNSALRAETRDNPRNLDCPTCGASDVLTPADRARGYQCNQCADRAEAGIDGY